MYFYETGARYTFGDIGTNIANYAVAEANADYRRKVRTKTIAAMKHKAEHGHVLGPPCFGYRHEDVQTGRTDAVGRPIRSHVTRKVYEPDGAVVREIFERYAVGQGLKKIADALNRKNTSTPRPRKLKGHDGVVQAIRPAAWAPSNVRSILRQPLYRGIARWNRLKQHDEDGNPILEVDPESEHVVAPYNPEWRIVSDALADAVDARFPESEPIGCCDGPVRRISDQATRCGLRSGSA